MKSATVKDVAERARVSVATVSRVLNGSSSVDAELQARVVAAIAELQFRPNRLARNLRTNSTKTIAFVVPDIENPFFISVVRGVEEVAFREGYSLLVCNTHDDIKRENQYVELLTDEAVAGLIICPTDERRGHTQVQQALNSGMAVVALDRRLEDASVDGVLSENFGSSRSAVSYLIELGHRRIGIVAGPDHFAPGRERRQGYEQALIDHGLPIDRELIKLTHFRASEAEGAVEGLLNLPDRPTALFISSGNAALGSLRAVNRHGLTIPDDISIVIFDDPDWASIYNPPLTCVAQKTRDLGVVASELLLRRIRGHEEPVQERRLPTRLIIRESCVPPR